MSDKLGSSAGQLLGEGIRRLGREELVALALEVCEDAAACGAPYHGNIHPGNISRGGSGAALGPRADHAPGDWSTDELEYMAPELFWNGTATAAADVYSVGLLLYAGVTGGLLPFFKRAPENMTNELRASALRRRMNGDPSACPPPRAGSSDLSSRSACASMPGSATGTPGSWPRPCAPAWARATPRPWRCSESPSASSQRSNA